MNPETYRSEPQRRVETFTIERGFLVRSVTPRYGKPYVHRCAKAVFDLVLEAIEGCEEGTTTPKVWGTYDLPASQVVVAFAFLKERGCVEVSGKRTYPKRAMREDALTEWHALEEKGSGS